MREVVCRDGLHFGFDPARTALVVIDMQRDFLDPQGMCAVEGDDISALRAIIPTVGALQQAARDAGMMLIHTREGYAPDLSDVHALKRDRGSIGESGPLGRFLIRGESGHDFIPELRPQADETVIDKPGFGAFYRTELEAVLRQREITHLVFAGVTTQCCVLSSLREAVDRGFYCLTLEDACAAVSPALHEAALTTIAGEGHLFGWVTRAEAFVAGCAAEKGGARSVPG